MQSKGANCLEGANALASRHTVWSQREIWKAQRLSRFTIGRKSTSFDVVTSWTWVPLLDFSPTLILDGHHGGSMKKLFSNAALFCIIALTFAPFTEAQISNPKIYIAPQNGFESYLAGAFTKKNVPAQMVQTEETADFILSPAPVQQNPKLPEARSPVACSHTVRASRETASVSLIDVKTKFRLHPLVTQRRQESNSFRHAGRSQFDNDPETGAHII